jgi:hypothetical protein
MINENESGQPRGNPRPIRVLTVKRRSLNVNHGFLPCPSNRLPKLLTRDGS